MKLLVYCVCYAALMVLLVPFVALSITFGSISLLLGRMMVWLDNAMTGINDPKSSLPKGKR